MEFWKVKKKEDEQDFLEIFVKGSYLGGHYELLSSKYHYFDAWLRYSVCLLWTFYSKVY